MRLDPADEIVFSDTHRAAYADALDIADVAVQATANHACLSRLATKTPSPRELDGQTQISGQLVISMREELGLVEEGERERMLTALLALSSDEEGDTARNDEAPNGG